MGPSGVGKELYAQYAHEASGRVANRFVAVNCGALPHELFENELFGHVGGAFTGARQQSDGLVAEAERGTLFLDELDSLPMSCQVKLLRFIQSKEYRRLGETRIRSADVRVIAATNTDLLRAVREGRFREDLFFRLHVVPIKVPPLCDRCEDIPLLLDHFAETYSKTYQLPRINIGDQAQRRLKSYLWPGNVRELENCVKYLTCLQLTRPVDIYDLPLLDEDRKEALHLEVDVSAETNLHKDFNDAKRELIEDFESHYIEKALRMANGNISKAALASGKPRRVFFELMRKHNISAQPFIGKVKHSAISTEMPEEPDLSDKPLTVLASQIQEF
jgi:DNA-binding NtrC family response regulator